MEKGTPFVSVSMLTYNHKKYVRQALDGILGQKTDFPVEILVHDDCSTDGTDRILAEYAEQYPDQVKPIYEEVNQYQNGNTDCNSRLNYTRALGKYTAFCEGDDFWDDPEKLKIQVEYMEAHPECTLCFTAIYDVDETGKRMDVFRPYPGDRDCTIADVMRMTKVWSIVSFLYRTEYLQNLPDYYHNCPVGDVPLLLVMGSHGTLHYIDRPTASYRHQSAGSWSSRLRQGDRAAKLRKHFDTMQTLYREFDEETGGKYHEESERAIRKMDFEYLIGTDQYRELLKDLSFVQQAGAVIGAVSPKLLHALRRK